MPRLTVEGEGTFEVSPDQRLVDALIETVGIDQLHACGGYARCTTCRVEFIEGEPAAMTEAEKAVLTTRGLIDTPHLRLSCQIMCDRDMHIKAVSRLRDHPERKDAGKMPEKQMTP
jgi:ferredoxin